MLKLSSVDLKTERIETLIIPVCENKEVHEDPVIKQLVRSAKKIAGLKGETGEEVTLYAPPKTKLKRVILFGLGKTKKMDSEALRSFSGKAVSHCMKKNLSEAWMAVPTASKLDMETDACTEALGEGAVLGNHVYKRYKKKTERTPMKSMHLLVQPPAVKPAATVIRRIETICRATILAREWVNTPSNDKPPEVFARSIAQAARKEKLKVTVLNDKTLKQKKFGALLAVSVGSQYKPRLVVLDYHPANAKKTVAFVGKGVTFDSGGLNLKPSGSLETMKCDMSGAAVVAATLIAIAKLKPKMRVIGLMPIVENMLSGTAIRPGDIVKSFDGKTVEIGNTDAEGRLILIDTLSYAIKTYKPQMIIDLATLTGACVIALGEKIAGTFSPDDSLAEAILASGVKTHERCWRLPLPEDYKKMLKSDFADIRNIGNARWGGAITAALFLSEFVKDTRWAHIDIAGPSYLKNTSAYCGAGATGFGVRLLCDLLDSL